MQDTIVREITVDAPKKRVFAAISDPEQIIQWFPDAVEGKLEAGEQPVFDFGEYGKNQVYIEAVEPDDYFAYRWIPGSNHFMGDARTQSNTLVEFRLEETETGTKVTLTESGFASLSYENAAERLSDNNGGWDYMMERLSKLFAKA